jgi:hypothetical protein
MLRVKELNAKAKSGRNQGRRCDDLRIQLDRLGNCEKDYQPRKLILGIRVAVKNGSVPELRLFPPA